MHFNNAGAAASRKGINVTVSSEESSRLELGKRNISELVRASVHYYNSEEEVDRFCASIHKVHRHLL